MDHTHAFACGGDLTPRIAHLDRIREPNVYGLFPAFAARLDRDAFNQALDDLAQLPRQLVEEIIRSVPSEWDVSSHARRALTELIVQRAQYLAENRAGIMGIHLYQRRLDLPADWEDDK